MRRKGNYEWMFIIICGMNGPQIQTGYKHGWESCGEDNVQPCSGTKTVHENESVCARLPKRDWVLIQVNRFFYLIKKKTFFMPI